MRQLDAEHLRAGIRVRVEVDEPDAAVRLRAGGKKVGPFVQPEKFRTLGCEFVDSDDKPILYFPARASKPNVSIPLQGGTPPFLNLNGASAGQDI